MKRHMKYNFSSIEKKWQTIWREKGIYEPDLRKAKKPFYNLMMFPYPSAEGLHVGNMYAFVGADIFGRMKRMQGNDVFEPIGLDGFGIHSENFALKTKTHPAKLSKVSEKNFYRQLEMIGNGFAWNEHLETYDQEYYRWTQWIFVQLWKHGLAYRKKQAVNWCPSCKTVLADEQVVSGKCERCSHEVIKKDLEQWFFRITKYADRLLKNLDRIDWSERVKIAQKNWIGKSEGLVFHSPVKDMDVVIETFSTHFEAFTADTFVVIAPDHPLLPKLLEGMVNREKVLVFCKKILEERTHGKKEKEPTGIFTGRYTIDPVGNGELPIWVASYALADYGTGIVKCSAHDERDFSFAKKYGIRLKPTLFPKDKNLRAAVLKLEVCYTDMHDGILAEPPSFAGKQVGSVRQEIIEYCVTKKLATLRTMFRLRDWLISRQRYWGPPIPMIHCEECARANKGEQKEMPGWYAVPEKDLPVELPVVTDFRPKGKGESPLASVKSFYEVQCPACKSKARRETDVSDTFLDSAWYYLRYTSSRLGKAPWDKRTIKKWLPASLYTGGAEHSVLHLLYVRFVALALHDMKLLEFGSSSAPKGEPFPKFRAHGLLIKEGAKMSKSKGNVINPDDYIKKFGADALRMYLMFLAPFEQGGDFRDAGILGVVRFLERVWKYSDHVQKIENKDQSLIHRTVKKVTDDIENLHYNTAISALMILLNDMEKRAVGKKEFGIFLKLLAPFAPHIAEELWQKHGNRIVIHISEWPTYDKKLIKEDKINLIVQVNGKLRATVSISVGINQEEVEKLALKEARVQTALGGKQPKKVIFVKNRIINFVV